MTRLSHPFHLPPFSFSRISSLEFASNQLKESKERQVKFTQSMIKTQSNLTLFENQISDLENRKMILEKELGLLQVQRTEISNSLQTQSELLSEIKSNLKESTKEVTQIQGRISEKESRIEELMSEWVSGIKKCKLEEIHVPLMEGSLDIVGMEILEVQFSFALRIRISSRCLIFLTPFFFLLQRGIGGLGGLGGSSDSMEIDSQATSQPSQSQPGSSQDGTRTRRPNIKLNYSSLSVVQKQVCLCRN